jgi:hypothetical protein
LVPNKGYTIEVNNEDDEDNNSLKEVDMNDKVVDFVEEEISMKKDDFTTTKTVDMGTTEGETSVGE